MEDELHDLKAAITILKDRANSALGGTKTHTIYDSSQEFIDFHLGELEEGMKLAKAEFIKLGDAMPRQSAMEFSGVRSTLTTTPERSYDMATGEVLR